MFRSLLLLLALSLPVGSTPVVPTVTLNNGLKMPVMSFGANVWDAPTTASATQYALQAGFRNFFSSILIGADNQKAQAPVFKSVSRSTLFLCGTVNTGSGACSGTADCYNATHQGGLEQFANLQLDYLDMLMLDYPADDCDGIKGQWKAFEEFYAANKTKSIAVSNFSPQQLQCIAGFPTSPALNQMPFSVGHGADTVVKDDAKFGTKVQAYSPLGNGDLANDPLCTAIGKPYNKTSAQVALKWVLQSQVSVCTESTKLVYLQQDIDLFDFELSASDMKQLNAVNPKIAKRSPVALPRKVGKPGKNDAAKIVAV